MRRIGVLNGRDRQFTDQLLVRLRSTPGVVAEPVSIGGETHDVDRPWDVVLDRVSHLVPFYRSILRKWAEDGVVVVPDPLAPSPLDVWSVGVIAGRLGVSVPRRVLIPGHDQPSGTDSESFSNLIYPLDWEAVFDHVGFPARLRDLGGRRSVSVSDPQAFFDGHRSFQAEAPLLEQYLGITESVRAWVVGANVRISRFDPLTGRGDDPRPLPETLRARIALDAFSVAQNLGQVFVALDFQVVDEAPFLTGAADVSPDLDQGQLDEELWEWLLAETSALMTSEIGTLDDSEQVAGADQDPAPTPAVTPEPVAPVDASPPGPGLPPQSVDQLIEPVPPASLRSSSVESPRPRRRRERGVEEARSGSQTAVDRPPSPRAQRRSTEIVGAPEVEPTNPIGKVRLKDRSETMKPGVEPKLGRREKEGSSATARKATTVRNRSTIRRASKKKVLDGE